MEIAAGAGVDVVNVRTTDEMAGAVASSLPTADVLVMAAAPADYRSAETAPQKMKKREGKSRLLELRPTVDILKDTKTARRSGAVVVGFALETENEIPNARAKLDEKDLDLVVLNSATEKGAGFGGDTNRVTLISASSEPEPLPLMTKVEVADAILDRVERLLNGR